MTTAITPGDLLESFKTGIVKVPLSFAFFANSISFFTGSALDNVGVFFWFTRDGGL